MRTTIKTLSSQEQKRNYHRPRRWPRRTLQGNTRGGGGGENLVNSNWIKLIANSSTGEEEEEKKQNSPSSCNQILQLISDLLKEWKKRLLSGTGSGKHTTRGRKGRKGEEEEINTKALELIKHCGCSVIAFFSLPPSSPRTQSTHHRSHPSPHLSRTFSLPQSILQQSDFLSFFSFSPLLQKYLFICNQVVPSPPTPPPPPLVQ